MIKKISRNFKISTNLLSSMALLAGSSFLLFHAIIGMRTDVFWQSATKSLSRTEYVDVADTTQVIMSKSHAFKTIQEDPSNFFTPVLLLYTLAQNSFPSENNVSQIKKFSQQEPILTNTLLDRSYSLNLHSYEFYMERIGFALISWDVLNAVVREAVLQDIRLLVSTGMMNKLVDLAIVTGRTTVLREAFIMDNKAFMSLHWALYKKRKALAEDCVAKSQRPCNKK